MRTRLTCLLLLAPACWAVEPPVLPPVAPVAPAAESPVALPGIPTGTAAADPAAIPAAEVLLAPGDEIRIEVYDNSDLDLNLRVSRDPSNFPLIGDIGSLVGLSPVQVGRLVTAKLADGFLLHPVVSVMVVNFTPRTVSVLGSVRAPQRITVDPHTTITAWQVLAQAGGLLDDADRARIMILRADAKQSGQIELLAFSASGSTPGAAGPGTEDTRLRPGDTVIVPRFDRAFVMGEVGKPGPVQIEGDAPMTVTRSIIIAGGFQRFARKSKVQLLRDGKTTTIDVDAILAGKSQDDSVLKPGDVVFVPESIF